MTLTRRDFLTGTGSAAGIGLLAPIVVRGGPAFAETAPDPATAQRKRLVVIFQLGGNDGLNTVVPYDDVPGAPRHSVYKKVRPTIALDPSAVRRLDLPGDDDQRLGLHPNLATLHSLYRQGRVAIVQGVDYPKHSYSHFTSTDIWESGQPDSSIDSGWLGRHLDRAGVGEGELRGVGIGNELPLSMQGHSQRGVEVARIPLAFADGTAAVGDARHNAFARYGDHPMEEYLRAIAGRQCRRTVELVEDLETQPASPRTANPLANALLTARTLLENDFGVECVFVYQPGYDTHATQLTRHVTLLGQLDGAIEAFYSGTIGGEPIAGYGPIKPSLADQTLIVTTSEFGRRIGETGGAAAAGTDHGAAAPLFIVGPPPSPTADVRLTGGIHGDHPAMGSIALPADNLMMTTDLRRVYQAVLTSWLGDPEPAYEGRYDPLPGLFTVGGA